MHRRRGRSSILLDRLGASPICGSISLLETRVAKRCWGGGGAAGLGSAVGAVFWRGVTHVGGCNQKMLLYATPQICLGRASRMARAGVRENAELETRVAKWC